MALTIPWLVEPGPPREAQDLLLPPPAAHLDQISHLIPLVSGVGKKDASAI